MEKEQKKLLLVAVSVGVFLLVTITVALFILTPKVQTQGTAFSSSQSILPERTQASEVISAVPVQPAINNSQETNIYIDGNPNTPVSVDKNNGERLTIQIPRPATAAVPDNPEVTTPAAVKTPAAAAPAVTPAKKTTATQPAAAPKPATTPKQTASSTPAKTPAKAINDYWIQTGAFTARVRAEDAKELLASSGLVSIIENREIDGKIFYRVRLGPYTSEREANYWLALVKSIDGFDGSQVRQTARQ